MWEKIVLNLIFNAFKFTFEGEIVVGLRETEGQAELTIRDTGVGIPEHELPRLFERFHGIAGQRSRSYEGSGIGLALVQELVKLQGGSILVSSAVGQGTSITIRIPFGTSHLAKEFINTGERLSAATGETLSTTPVRADAWVEEALHWLADDSAPEEVRGASDLSGDISALHAGTRILLADDNADMRGYVRRLFGGVCLPSYYLPALWVLLT
jgi:Histidine kinase-, DNA gyrase B-, and HSP90-like ATPase